MKSQNPSTYTGYGKYVTIITNSVMIFMIIIAKTNK